MTSYFYSKFRTYSKTSLCLSYTTTLLKYQNFTCHITIAGTSHKQPQGKVCILSVGTNLLDNKIPKSPEMMMKLVLTLLFVAHV